MNKTHRTTRHIITRGVQALAVAAFLPLATTVCLGADATENWGKHCASCHGKDGKGETKAGKKAGVKDQTDAAYHSNLTDDKMFKSIKEGLKDGEKEKMKPYAEKLSDDEIKALVAKVRSFKK